MVAAKYRQWMGLNPGYLLIACAAIMVFALFLPWAVIAKPLRLMMELFGPARATLTGWQLHGIFLALAAVGVAICGVIYLRAQAGLRTKGALIALTIVSALIAALDIGDVLGRLDAARNEFGPLDTRGFGFGVGVLIEGLAIVVLAVGTLRAVSWMPGDTETPPHVLELLQRLKTTLRYGWRRDLAS